MSFYIKLYTLDNEFIKRSSFVPNGFTGFVEHTSGTKEWYLNGGWHRLDGAAIERSDGTKYWYINDKQVSKEQHKLYVDIMKLKGLI